MRAVVFFKKDDYINIPATSIDYDCGWIRIFNGDKLVGIFGEECVSCAYLSEKK